jgi:SM-20-related protein
LGERAERARRELSFTRAAICVGQTKPDRTHLVRLLSDEQVSDLGRVGFCIGAAPRAHFSQLAQWCRKANHAGFFVPAQTGRSKLKSHARTDSTLWLEADGQSSVPDGADLARSYFEQLRLELNSEAYLGLRKFELQLARYCSGDRYEKHLDALVGQENRRVTAIVYLNEQWRPEHGGQLVLHTAMPRSVVPRAFTLVVFLSETIEHEVEVTAVDRFAVTAWYGAHS